MTQARYRIPIDHKLVNLQTARSRAGWDTIEGRALDVAIYAHIGSVSALKKTFDRLHAALEGHADQDLHDRGRTDRGLSSD